MITETVTTKSGREYTIEKDDRMYARRLGPKYLHYQINNIRFAYDICTAKPQVRTMIDCGMNVGMNTIEYATFAQRVVGYDPDPLMYKLAVHNIIQNKMKWDDTLPYMWSHSREITGDIDTHRVALSNTSGNAKLIIHPRNRGHNHVWNGVKRTEKELLPVDQRCLDDYAFEDVDYIKIDTEGHELPLLEGAQKTVDSCRPVVQCEIIAEQCRRYNYTAEDIWQYFTSRDYRVFTRDHIERTHGISTVHLGRGRYQIQHNGARIFRNMDFWFIPAEHPWITQNPIANLFE